MDNFINPVYLDWFINLGADVVIYGVVGGVLCMALSYVIISAIKLIYRSLF